MTRILLALVIAFGSGAWGQAQKPGFAASTPTATAPLSSTETTAPVVAAPAVASMASTPGDPLALQKEIARKQARSVGARLIPWEPLPQAVPTDCDPMPESEVGPLIEGAAKREQVDAKVIRAVMEQESALRPCAVSQSGAQGLMQLMPETATQFAVTDVFDPSQNVDAGTRYLKQLLARYKGDLKQALAAYNAGPSEVDRAGGVPKIAETQAYVEGIMKKVAARGIAVESKPAGN